VTVLGVPPERELPEPGGDRDLVDVLPEAPANAEAIELGALPEAPAEPSLVEPSLVEISAPGERYRPRSRSWIKPWWQAPTPRVITQVGFLGSVLLLIGSLGAGALPTYDPVNHIPVLWSLRRGPGPTVALGLVYSGGALLALAWLHLGRLIREARAGLPTPGAGLREVLRTGAWWTAPLLVAVPLASRDLYSYAAQAQITHAGLDPYTQGPQSSLGPFTDEVGYMWQDTPAPYGPLFLTLGRLVAILTRDHVLFTVLAMRLVAVAGVLLTVRYLPRLARACGADPSTAVWLALVNPLLLIHFVGGGHNDAVMVGLLVAGVTIAVESVPGDANAQRRLAIGVVLCTLALLVKAPAVFALAFLVPVWAARLEGERRWLRAIARIAVVATVTFVVATLAFGLGIGWVRQLNTPGAVVNPLSVPTGLGLLTAMLARVGPYIDSGNPVIRIFRNAFLVITAGVCLRLWQRTRSKADGKPGLDPVLALGLALLALVVLGPVVQPWYLLWPFAFLGAVRLPEWAIAVTAGFSVALVMLITPQGSALLLAWAPMVAAAGAAVLATRMILVDGSPGSPVLARDRVRAGVPATSTTTG
jgi:hypothetical protein